MKFNYKENQNNHRGVSLCEIISQLDFADKSGFFEGLNIESIDIEFRINGRDFDFGLFIDTLRERFDLAVREQARRLLLQDANDLVNGMYDLRQHLKAKINEKFPGAFDEE